MPLRAQDPYRHKRMALRNFQAPESSWLSADPREVLPVAGEATALGRCPIPGAPAVDPPLRAPDPPTNMATDRGSRSF